MFHKFLQLGFPSLQCKKVAKHFKFMKSENALPLVVFPMMCKVIAIPNWSGGFKYMYLSC